ncbi:MAG: PDZ domain-containing protein, partial [Bacteroidota bacterium]|nr:PDZ domain-containing protein [Bacteroidota bacterium]
MKLSFYNPKRLAFVGTVLVLTSALLGARIEKAFTLDNTYEEIQKYADVLNLVQKNYVDKVDINELNEAAIVGMLAKLDPHSVYMPPKNVKQSAEDFEGKFEGIGVRFAMAHDSVLIDEVIPGGPSEMVGLIAGDKIYAIDGKKTTGFTEDSVVHHLRGPKGTKVTVTVARSGMPLESGGPKPLNF